MESDSMQRLILALHEAMLGMISSNVAAVSLLVDSEIRALDGAHGSSEVNGVLCVALVHESEEDRERASDIVTNLNAVMPVDPNIDLSVWVGSEWWKSDWEGRNGILLYSKYFD